MKAIARMIPPPSPSSSDPITINGRTYRSVGAAFVDMLAIDGLIAANNNNWQFMGLVGQTTDRMTAADNNATQLLFPGARFIDLTLGKVLYWDATASLWRDGVTAVAA